MVVLNENFAPENPALGSNEARPRGDGEPKASPEEGFKRVPGIGQFEPQNRVGIFLAGWVIASGLIGLQPATASEKNGLRLR